MPTKPESTQSVATAGHTIMDITDLSVHFDLQGSAFARLFGRKVGTVKAVDGVNLRMRAGEVVGLVGESGSGKSTLGRSLLGLVPATSGSIFFEDVDIATMSRRDLREIRKYVQMIFQDPNAALNPGMTIEQAVGDPLRIHGMKSADERRKRVIDALERVGLSPVELFLSKYPKDLSGGQKQRVVIARAIILGPSVLVADEPISMLDMSVRAKILQLMLDLKEQLDLTYVYITHDLASAKFFCDRIAIMYLGRIVEIGETAEIFANPKHPYTKALLAAIPDPDPERSIPRDLLKGEIPDAAEPPSGCAFHPRCPAGLRHVRLGVTRPVRNTGEPLAADGRLHLRCRAQPDRQPGRARATRRATLLFSRPPVTGRLTPSTRSSTRCVGRTRRPASGPASTPSSAMVPA